MASEGSGSIEALDPRHREIFTHTGSVRDTDSSSRLASVVYNVGQDVFTFLFYPTGEATVVGSEVDALLTQGVRALFIEVAHQVQNVIEFEEVLNILNSEEARISLYRLLDLRSQMDDWSKVF